MQLRLWVTTQLISPASLLFCRFWLVGPWEIWYGVTSEHILWIKLMSTSCDIKLSWMSKNTTDDKAILVQVLDLCHQATSHYLNQCLARSMLPYGVIGPQLYHGKSKETSELHLTDVLFGKAAWLVISLHKWSVLVKKILEKTFLWCVDWRWLESSVLFSKCDEFLKLFDLLWDLCQDGIIS